MRLKNCVRINKIGGRGKSCIEFTLSFKIILRNRLTRKVAREDLKNPFFERKKKTQKDDSFHSMRSLLLLQTPFEPQQRILT